MKASPFQGNFSTGEVTPLMHGRVDAERYRSAMGECTNYIPTVQGALVRRPGTAFVSEVKTSAKKTRLLRFEFSTTQSYIIEMGEFYVRFYTDQAQLVSGGVAYEVASPYAESEIFDVRYTQSGDIVYCVHSNHTLYTLERLGATSWNFSQKFISTGPFLPIGATTDATLTTVQSGAGIFDYTVTASKSIFVASDAGRVIRIKSGSTWYSITIGTVVSDTVFTKSTKVNIPNTTTSDWRMGVYYTGNYPSTITFHEDRLFLGGSPDFPNRLDGSATSDYLNFAPSASDGTITVNNGLSFSLNAAELNAAAWLTSDEKGLLCGSVGAEWIVKPSSNLEALSALNISAKKATTLGSTNVQAVQAGRATLFVQKSGRKIREFTYFYDVDGFQANDLTLLAEHLTLSGIKEMAYMREPHPIVWCVKNNGELLAMTYDRDAEALKVGWSRHLIGGQTEAAGSTAEVESVAIIPTPDGTRDELWMVVRRSIGLTSKRYIERMTQFFDDDMDPQEAVHLDCSLTYNNPKTITAVSLGPQIVFTITSHGLIANDRFMVNNCNGATQLNNKIYTAFFVSGNDVTVLENGTGFDLYVSGGEARKMVSSISGLAHLNGETATIFADGAPLNDVTVTAGSVALSTSAAVVHIGLRFKSRGQLLRFEAGAADGVALGKVRRTHRCGWFLHRTLGLKVGTNSNQLDLLPLNKGPDVLGQAPALFSGIVSETLEANYDTENFISFEQEDPFPGTIIAVMPQLVTQDR